MIGFGKIRSYQWFWRREQEVLIKKIIVTIMELQLHILTSNVTLFYHIFRLVWTLSTAPTCPVVSGLGRLPNKRFCGPLGLQK